MSIESQYIRLGRDETPGGAPHSSEAAETSIPALQQIDEVLTQGGMLILPLQGNQPMSILPTGSNEYLARMKRLTRNIKENLADGGYFGNYRTHRFEYIHIQPSALLIHPDDQDLTLPQLQLREGVRALLAEELETALGETDRSTLPVHTQERFGVIARPTDQIFLRPDEYQAFFGIVTDQMSERRYKASVALLPDITVNLSPRQWQWQFLFLRGEARLNESRFQDALPDYSRAIETLRLLPRQPDTLYSQEFVLRLHSAAAHLEVGNTDNAYEQYQALVPEIRPELDYPYQGETYWQLSLVERNLAQTKGKGSQEYTRLLQNSLEHAKKAQEIYRENQDEINTDLLEYQIALVEQSLDYSDSAVKRVNDIMHKWSQRVTDSMVDTTPGSIEIVIRCAYFFANLFAHQGNNYGALGTLERTLPLQLITSRVIKAELYTIKGDIQSKLGQNEYALTSYQTALAEVMDSQRIRVMQSIQDKIDDLLKTMNSQAPEIE